MAHGWQDAIRGDRTHGSLERTSQMNEQPGEGAHTLDEKAVGVWELLILKRASVYRLARRATIVDAKRPFVWPVKMVRLSRQCHI